MHPSSHLSPVLYALPWYKHTSLDPVNGLDGLGCVCPVIVPGTPVRIVVFGFVTEFVGWHCGTRQHESLGSVTIVQPD